MLAFLDTGFTGLAIWPRLLSVGLVTDHGRDREFYAEDTDPERIDAIHRFGRGVVLPQFGRVADAACTCAERGARLSTCLYERVADLRLNESVELAFGYHLDWELIDRSMMAAVPASWTATRCRIRPVNVHEIAGSAPGHLAADAYFKAQATAPLSWHHALRDARALRLAYEVCIHASGRLNQPPMMSERKLDGRHFGQHDVQFAHE